MREYLVYVEGTSRNRLTGDTYQFKLSFTLTVNFIRKQGEKSKGSLFYDLILKEAKKAYYKFLDLNPKWFDIDTINIVNIVDLSIITDGIELV